MHVHIQFPESVQSLPAGGRSLSDQCAVRRQTGARASLSRWIIYPAIGHTCQSHSHSRGIAPSSLRGYRRPARLNSSLGFGSVAVYFTRIKSAQNLPHKLIEPFECHLQVLSGTLRYATKRSGSGARKNGIVAQQGSR